ncbi:MAG: flagellar motor stator protein MotA [Bdellovibrionales bacterium]
MGLFIGIVVVIVCTFGGYMAMGGHIAVLWQPFEFVIIFGSAVGAFIIANPPHVKKRVMKEIGSLSKKPKYGKAEFLELLSMMYLTFKLAKTKGMLAMEQHIENPEQSTLFSQFPTFVHDHHAVEFFCDYLRLVSLGSDKPYEIEALMDEELEVHHKEDHDVSHSLQQMADGMPALGIVAAVLGVIKTMGAITEPPEVLGHLIGGALVGTFLGVFLSYGFIGPMSTSLGARHTAQSKYMQCMKVGLIAHLHGYAPAISAEYARKALMSDVRPTFVELEEATGTLTLPG